MVPLRAARYGPQIRRFTRAPAAQFADDFAHHAPNVARLNHGSFGAAPKPVLEAEQAIRMNWLRQPDAEYFSRALDEDLAAAAVAAGAAIGAPAGTAALVENATVATAIALHRWRGRGAALLLSCAYGGVKRAARALLGPEHVVEAPVPFPGAPVSAPVPFPGAPPPAAPAAEPVAAAEPPPPPLLPAFGALGLPEVDSDEEAGLSF